MITVYIASPYTNGDVAENVRNSLDCANALMEIGFVPYPPLLTHFWHFFSPKSHSKWLEYDLEILSRMDCVLRLPGESKGADIEVDFAKENNIPVFYSIYELEQWRILG